MFLPLAEALSFRRLFDSLGWVKDKRKENSNTNVYILEFRKLISIMGDREITDLSPLSLSLHLSHFNNISQK